MSSTVMARPEVWAFSPQTLTFSSAGLLSEARVGLAATTVLDNGAPAVMFTGGKGPSAVSSR